MLVKACTDNLTSTCTALIIIVVLISVGNFHSPGHKISWRTIGNFCSQGNGISRWIVGNFRSPGHRISISSVC